MREQADGGARIGQNRFGHAVVDQRQPARGDLAGGETIGHAALDAPEMTEAAVGQNVGGLARPG